MKQPLLTAALLVTTTVLVGTSESQNKTRSGIPQTGKNVTINGCLTKGPHETYELVDRQGIHNMISKSEKINLDSYVGQSVTLVGERSAIPNAEKLTKPLFKVSEVQTVAGKCGK